MNVLVIVDMQYDFGHRNLTRRILELVAENDYTIATRDWHPPDHSSFAEHGGPWPTHCVAGTVGAALYDEIDQAADAIVSKGTDRALSGYSAAENPGFLPLLEGIASPLSTITVCGVALDWCVPHTALSIKVAFGRVVVPRSATVGLAEDTTAEAICRMEEVGIVYDRDR